MKKVASAEEAVSVVKAGQRIFIQGEAATLNRLMQALMQKGEHLRDVELIHLHLMGEIPYAEEAFKRSFRVANLFVGKNVRHTLDYQTIDYLPCFLSQIPSFHIDYCIEVDEPVHVNEKYPFTEVESKIGENVALLVEDGATLQIGIGEVPDAVLAALKHHRHLGLHTEMWSDGALELIEAGVIDNSQKMVFPGKCISSFIVGSQRLYDFVHDNPTVVQLDIAYVNLPTTIARNPQATAINSAIEIDLTGQICADSVGHRIVSGVGGQMDFMYGATLSRGGKPIIAITSRSKGGEQRMPIMLSPNTGV